MAKSKSFFGLRTGSTKTLTFQVLNGKQITKDRVEIVKNPRTLSQMVTRCMMATASAAYSGMREIANHSFEGYSYGQQNMSKFIAENIALLSANLDAAQSQFSYNEYKNRALLPGAYRVSMGSLPKSTYTFSASSGEGTITLALTPSGIASGFTANSFAAALGLSVGEMSTIVMLYGNAAATGWNFGFVRVKFIKAGTTAITAQNLADYFEIESNIGTPTPTISATGVSLAFANVDIADTSAIVRGAIYSRKSANGWLRSTCDLTVPAGTALAPDFETAIATYPVGTDYILNGGAI